MVWIGVNHILSILFIFLDAAAAAVSIRKIGYISLQNYENIFILWKINNPKTYGGRWTYFMFRLICIFFLFTVCWHQWFVWRPNDPCYIIPSNKFKPLYRTNKRKERKMASFNRSDLVSVVVIGWKFSMGKYLFQNARTNSTPM